MSENTELVESKLRALAERVKEVRLQGTFDENSEELVNSLDQVIDDLIKLYPEELSEVKKWD